jgi:hypothetical protein
MIDEKIALKRLKQRIQLIARGIVVPQRKGEKPIYHMQSQLGGIGYVGRQYHVCYSGEESPSAMIRVALYPEGHYFSKYAIRAKRSEKNPHTLILENGVVLIGGPPLLSRGMSIANGSPIETIGSMHCYNTLGIATDFRCVYFDGKGGECKFCTIDKPAKINLCPQVIPDEQIIEMLKTTIKYDNVRSLVVTSGTYPDAEGVAQRYITLFRKLREFTNLTIRFEIEPLNDLSYLKDLSEYSKGAIGIYIESFDEKVRRQMCPAKAKKIPREQYFENWKEAVRYFGRGYVSTHVVLGFGENYDKILQGVEESARLGVKTVLMLLSIGSDALGEKFIPSYIGKEDELVDLHIETGKIMVKYGVEHRFGDPGCHGCAGCSAMMETAQYARFVS